MVRPLRSARLLLAGIFLLAGCQFGAPPPAPPEEFQDFSVGLFGGVAGLQQVLRVRKDGVAVVASSKPASGRVGSAKLAEVRELLTSEEFRREVTATQDRPPGSDRCSDLFIREVTMGSLSVRKTDRCGNETRPDTPTFDKILGLLADEMDGRFTEPLGAAAPPAVSIRLVREPRAGTPGYTLDVDRSGPVSRRGLTTAIERRTLAPEDLATLQLLGEVAGEDPRACTRDVRYRLAINSTPPVEGTDCSLQNRSPQFWAIVRVLENLFD